MPDRLRRSYRVLIALAPLALLAGVALRWTHHAPAALVLAGGPDFYESRARQEARRLGLDTSDWSATATPQLNSAAQRFWSSRVPAAGGAQFRLSPPLRVEVELSPPGGGPKFRVELSPGGEALAWSGNAAAGNRRPDEEAARAYAAGWLSRFGAPQVAEWEPVSRSRRGEDDEEASQFRGEVWFTAEPPVRYRVEIEAGEKGARSASGSLLSPRL